MGPPATCEALVVRVADGESPKLCKEQITIPKPTGHELLVKVDFVAQNPTDVQAFDSNAFGDGAILGCDFVGTVEESAEDAQTARGTKVAGLIWGGEVKGRGGFSQYTIADDQISFIVPEGITPEAASTVPLAAATSELALFSKDCLGISRSGPNRTILVWGASSSVGQYAVQIAVINDIDVIATCSPHNFDTVKSLGAKHVFDYSDDKVVDRIKEVCPQLLYVFDTIGNENTSATASQAIAESGGTLCTVRPGKTFTQNVTKQTRVTDVFVWTAFYKDHTYGDYKWPAHEDDHRIAKEFFSNLPGWLVSGKIKPSRPKVFETGLDGVPDGFQEHRDGTISGYKIVYKLH